jgi:uncharacterized protein (DUF58 family)
VAAGGVLLTLVAFMFDASPLFVPGIAFTALGLATPAWISLSAGGSSVRRRLHADRVLEGEPLEATIEVRRGRFGLPGARVIDPLADHSVAIGRSMSLIGGAREAHVRIVASFPRRGARQIAPSSLIIQDALELARRGGCGLLLPGERRAIAVEPDLASWPGTHARLAVVEGGPGTRPPILAGGARLGPVLYVAAQPLERLPTALAAVGRGGCVIVLPRELTNRMQARPSFEVAGCYGFAVRARAGSSPFAERAA